MIGLSSEPLHGAQGRTRTATTRRSPAPEAGVSTNFTTWAYLVDFIYYFAYRKHLLLDEARLPMSKVRDW